jgi:hypothetical protein
MSSRTAGSTDFPVGEWMAWRRSAQTVTRTWNEWLAAERGDRAERYVCHRRALAEEERTAAELERAVMTERPRASSQIGAPARSAPLEQLCAHPSQTKLSVDAP